VTASLPHGIPAASNTARGTGDLFVEGCAGPLRVRGGAHAWARQINPEFAPAPGGVLADASAVWVLGEKTEGAPILASARNGAKLEVFGLTYWPVQGAQDRATALYDTDAWLFVTASRRPGVAPYGLWASETRAGVTRTLTEPASFYAGLPGGVRPP